MLIRQAQKEDARRISYLIQKNTEQVTENNYSSEQIAIWKKANTSQMILRQMEKRIIFCALKNGKLLGTIALQGEEVVGLYVSYSQRGKGVGRKLLNHLEDYAGRNGIKELTLTSTPSALSFYERNGFIAMEPVIVPIAGVDFFETKMIKPLD